MEKENAKVPLLATVTSLEEEMNKLYPLNLNPCIYRVPKHIRIINPSAYTPKVVSIGPIHHKTEGLESMEEYKQRFLQLFLEKVKMSLEDYAKFVEGREGRLRECYADNFDLTSDEFVKIMMVDSAFVYEMLDMIGIKIDNRDTRTKIFNKPFLLMNVIEDLMLLENQIPLFILEDLFKKARSARPSTSSIRRVDPEHSNVNQPWEKDASKVMRKTDPNTSSSNLKGASKVEEQSKPDISQILGNRIKPQRAETYATSAPEPGYWWEKNASQMKRQIGPNVSLNLEDISEAEVGIKFAISPDAYSSLEAEVAAQTEDMDMMPEPDPVITPDLLADSFMVLVYKFINWRPDIGTRPFDFNKVVYPSEGVHLLDCLRTCHLSKDPQSPEAENKTHRGESYSQARESESRNIFCQLPEKVRHLVLGCLARCPLACSKPDPPEKADGASHLLVPVPTVTELHQSGVTFAENKDSNRLLDITFNCQRGILKIPHFFMGDSTETIFRNLLVFEQCHYEGKHWITDYFTLLDQFINDPSDVNLLVQSGVLENALGDNKRAARIINNITLGLIVSQKRHFDVQRKELTKYYRVPCHKWKVILKQKYFNSPWAIISLMAALILLVLAVLQTVYAIIFK